MEPVDEGKRWRRWGIVLLVVAAVLWSLNGLFIKGLHEDEIAGVSIAGFRSLFAFLALTPFVLRRSKRVTEPWWCLGTVLTFTGMCATFVIATTLTSAANAIILQYSAPIWVFLVAPLVTGERATRPQLWALVVSLLGVGVIFGWQFEAASLGLVVGLASGVVFGVQSVLFRRVRAIDPLVLTWLACGGSALVLVGVALATGQARLSGNAVWWLVLMGAVQFGLPYVLFSWAIKHVSAQEGVLIVLVEAVLNPIWVWLLRGEVPHVSTLVGGVFIMSGVMFLALGRVKIPRGD